MNWNWQLKDWPNFNYNEDKLRELEAVFLKESSTVYGAYQHIDDNNKKNIIVELITDEAINTSEIEGEILDRGSVQSSIRRNLGLTTDKKKIPQNEKGISDMMICLYETFDSEITHKYIYHLHSKLANGQKNIKNIGEYRTHEEAMQVVSGPIHKPKIHFEAPPSKDVPNNMDNFILWFNIASKIKSTNLQTIINAGIAHLYFVSIHPLEDGNGRIGRALAEKLISKSLGYPALISLSTIIQKNKKKYYSILEDHNFTLEITEYLLYFSRIVLSAQKLSRKMIDFTIKKTKIYDKFSSRLNERQLKVLNRIFEEGLDGFAGGLSAQNYKSIVKKISDSSVTRDLQELVAMGLFFKTGETKHTRYFVDFSVA